jgi:hypothetical protein
MHPLTLYAIGIAVLCYALYSFSTAISKRNAKYNPRGLPGPALIPWVGRIHDLPIDYMWLKFKEWSDTYGPIYRTKMLGANFVIISDEAMAEDILVKRAKVYSDRPQIRSLYDSKSTHGSMEYLPLMGKNREFPSRGVIVCLLTPCQNIGLVKESSHTLTLLKPATPITMVPWITR